MSRGEGTPKRDSSSRLWYYESLVVSTNSSS